MAATQTIEPAATAQAQPAAAELPWVVEEIRLPPPPPSLAVGRRHEPFPLNWSVVALTFATALGIVLGSHRADASKPRELLPVMIVTKAR